MVQLAEKTITLEEFLKLPETKPASEYINGEIIQKPMPQGKHSCLQGEMITTVNIIAKNQRVALPELRCTFGGRSVVPDVVVLRWERIPRDENGDIANVFASYPDWTIEVLSPEQSVSKVTKNILHCLQHGCSLGWLIDPEEKYVLVYPQGKQPELLDIESDLLPVPDFLPELKLTVGDVFGWLKL